MELLAAFWQVFRTETVLAMDDFGSTENLKIRVFDGVFFESVY